MEKNYQLLSLIKTSIKKSFLFIIILMLAGSSPIFGQQSYTFTTAGVTGSVGPTALQVSTAYASTNLSGTNVTVTTQGFQKWTVPTSGLYRITAVGAEGGSSHGANPGADGGKGASMSGDFNLTAGQIFTIVVGQAGGATGYGGGGGGGSYVFTGVNVPLCVAGGGGGAYGYIGDARGCTAGYPGLTATSGGTSNVPGGPTYGNPALGTGGGAPGMGGTIGYGGGSGVASGGGGILSDGANGGTPTSIYCYGGKSFLNGSMGGQGTSALCNGGFGGGGGAQAGTGYGAGGGGYSGGGGGSLVGSPLVSGNGGGGGSYNSGTNQLNAAGTNTGNGVVIIKELCNITLVANGTNVNGAICTGASVTLTTNGVGNYSWSTGASTSSIVISPTITTTYTLSATSVSNCTAYAAITVTVDQGAPSLTFTNTANAGGICPTKSVALTASGATTYTWTGGSPTVTNGVVFNPITTSGYTVTGSNACGSNSAATSVSIHPPPTVNLATSASTICSGVTVTLTATGNATAYAWSGGSGAITNGVGFNPSFTATYTAIGTSALSCTLAAAIPVTVVTTPINAPVATPPLICIGKSSTLTASGATSYTWATATQTVFTTSFTATPAAPGITTYTVTKSNANCFNTQVVSVTTNSLPTIFAIVTPTIVCALKPATLAIGGAQTYTWTSPGPPTFSFTGASPVVYPPVSSVYSVAASDGTCISTTTVYLATNPNPTITVGATSSVVCSGDATTLTAQGGINYTWTAGTTTLNTQAVTINPTTAVAYTAEGDNGFGCTSSALQIVLVNPNPTLTVNATKTLVCSGGPSTLIASGANTYSWDANANNALTSSTIVNPTSPTSGSMVYSVEGKYTATGCKSTNTVLVAIFVPTLTVTGNTNTCIGGIVNLSPSGGNSGSYVWFTSIGGNPYNFATLTTTVAAAAIFTVNAITSSVSVNCPATQTVAVDVFFNPTITAVPQRTTICFKESVDVYASGGATYQWNNAMTGGTINVNPTINTTYTVTGTDANGCVNTGTVQVKVSGCAGIGELNGPGAALAIYPNPSRGEFTIESNSDLKLSLVNELGQLVRVIELSAANNYKISVNDLSQGIYFISGQKDNIHVYEKIVVTK